MSDFKGRQFKGKIILWAVRWYCKYGISYRELEEMREERGIHSDHTTLYRWVQHYAPLIEKRLRWYWSRPTSSSWRLDETYIKVKGKWTYYYRAIDKNGHTIDFYLSTTRNAKAAKRFLVKPTLGFKSMKTAYATLKGFEVMRALKKGQGSVWRYQPGVKGEVCLINQNFGLCAA